METARVASDIIVGVRSWGACPGSPRPISRNMASVRGFGREAGSVPAETERHPAGGSELKIASAMRDRQAFSTQTKRTVRIVTLSLP